MRELVTLSIDGKEVRVQPGVTIYWAAKAAGIEVPHLCYGEDIHPLSSCRLCVVEVEGMKSLAASCSYPVSPGMVVHTASERVMKARRLNLELILSDHEITCITCEKSGSCLLEKYAYAFGISESVFSGPNRARNTFPVKEENPFMVRDYNKCILCGRCVLACAELQYDSAIDYAERGFKARISTAFDRPLQDTTCEFCGRCISVCPVGALTEKERVKKGREWEFEVTSTICPYCGCGCTLEMHVRDGRLVKVTTPAKGTVSKGNLCVKGKFGTYYINHPERLTTPLIRKATKNGGRPAAKGGEFVEASWDEALDLVAKRLREIKDKYGPNAIGGLSSAKCTNEENYVFQKFMRAVIGTNNVDHCARLCHSSTVAGLAKAFGSGAMTNSIAELRFADCIFVTGSNTTEAHPIIGLEVKAAVKKNGAILIVADPREIDLVGVAALHLRQRSGTDVALFNGMMQVILSEGLEDKDFIDKRTDDFDKFKAVVMQYTPEKVEKITGVPKDKIIQAARLYARAEKASIIYSMGITQHTTGTDNVLSLANLAMVTGNVGKKSTGVNPLRGQNNVQGACDLGALPNVYPGYQQVANPQVQEKFEKAWDASLSLLPGLTVVEMLHGIEDGKIRGMYTMGENPFLSDPNVNRVRKDLEALEFLVVQDIFMSETAQYADVVLPAASFAEKDGTFTNTERRVQLLRKVLDPPGQAKADWQILGELASRLGYTMYYAGTAEIMEEIAGLTPIYGGITHERLQGFGLQWPCPDREHAGTPYLHKGMFSRGKGLFNAVEYIPPAEEPDVQYPLLLTTGRILYHFHTGTMSRRVDGLHAIRPDGFVEIHPDDAKALKLAHGDMARVSSRRGTVTAKTVVTERSRPGTVFMTFHYREAAANILTNDALDPVAKIPEFKVCAVKVEKFEAAKKKEKVKARG
ncbi:MAG: formate dehydrogenase subunit alpha [Spirochaetaceae bacterium]|nr:MAG: formate dehydrogenase subunit alpha [Spirochaetaceae bacterium]